MEKAKSEAKLARCNERKHENSPHDLMEDQKNGDEPKSTDELGLITERENGNSLKKLACIRNTDRTTE